MKNSLRYLSFLLILSCFTSAYAYEFKHFKLHGELEYKRKLKAGLLRGARRSGSDKNDLIKTSPLLDEIEGILTGEYEGIGKDQTDKLLKNYNLGGGVLNFSGFTWHKPMLNYDIDVNRELAPDLMSNKWIVQDSFTITIEAATLLSNLQQQKSLSLTDIDLGAFAGVSFKRTYRYNHFADSYRKGLTSDFTKLFLAFKKMHIDKVFDLDDYEVLKKTDEYTFNAGGLVKAPIGSSVGASAGALVKRSYESTVMIQKLGPEDNDNYVDFRLSVENKKLKSTRAELTIQADFFNLLKLELLEFDLEYEFGESQKTFLNFSSSDLKQIRQISGEWHELKQLLKGKSNIRFLSDLVTSHEKRIQENMNSKFSFLLFGSMKKRASEQVHIIKDGIEKTFFTSFSESLTYVESFFSKLFQSALFKIFNFSSSTKKRMATRKVLEMEYEKVRGLPPTSVKNEKQFSLQYTHEIEIAKTHKWYHRNYRNSAVKHLKSMTDVPSALIKHVKKKKLRGPLKISTKILIQEAGLTYFNRLSVNQVVPALLTVCDISKRDWRKYSTKKRRRRYLRGRLDHEEKCFRKLLSRLESYKKQYDPDKFVDLFKLKKFIGLYFSKAKNIKHITYLFGSNTLFYHGEFVAKTKSGQNFQTFFKSGQFTGLGVIDNFKNSKIITPIYVDYGSN